MMVSFDSLLGVVYLDESLKCPSGVMDGNCTIFYHGKWCVVSKRKSRTKVKKEQEYAMVSF
jgi:hypothetical protein